MLQKGALSFQRWVQLSKVGDVRLFFHTKYLSTESSGCHHLSPPPSLSSLSVKVQSLCPANTERLLVPSSREELAWRSKGTARQFLKHCLHVGMVAELCTGGVPVCPHLPPNNVLPQHPGSALLSFSFIPPRVTFNFFRSDFAKNTCFIFYSFRVKGQLLCNSPTLMKTYGFVPRLKAVAVLKWRKATQKWTENITYLKDCLFLRYF